jgi:hypothetical protein
MENYAANGTVPTGSSGRWAQHTPTVKKDQMSSKSLDRGVFLSDFGLYPVRFVGRGMHLEICHPEYSTPILTSRVQEIPECAERVPVLDQAP